MTISDKLSSNDCDSSVSEERVLLFNNYIVNSDPKDIYSRSIANE